MIAVVRDTKLIVQEMRDFIPLNLIKWVKQDVSNIDWVKRMKVVLQSLSFATRPSGLSKPAAATRTALVTSICCGPPSAFREWRSNPVFFS